MKSAKRRQLNRNKFLCYLQLINSYTKLEIFLISGSRPLQSSLLNVRISRPFIFMVLIGCPFRHARIASRDLHVNTPPSSALSNFPSVWLACPTNFWIWTETGGNDVYSAPVLSVSRSPGFSFSVWMSSRWTSWTFSIWPRGLQWTGASFRSIISNTDWSNCLALIPRAEEEWGLVPRKWVTSLEPRHLHDPRCRLDLNSAVGLSSVAVRTATR